jgi:RimJ/RimL family protein N-acetyltransferase
MISGIRTKLRPATMTDRRRIYLWMAHSDATPSMMGPPDYTDHPIPSWQEFCQDYGEQFFRPSGDGKGRSFIIIADGEEVGTIGYDLCDKKKSRAVLDVWLRGEKYCGRGHGTDSLNALRRHLFEEYGIRNLSISPSSRNKRAVAAYSKSGFRRVAMTKEEIEDQFGRGVSILDYRDNMVMKRVMRGRISARPRPSAIL